MKKYLLITVLPFVLSACATTYYQSEGNPTHYDDGSTQVKLKVNDDEKLSEGSEITALNKTCKTKYIKDRERLSCLRKLASIGKVVGISKDNMATVEFKQGESIGKDTEFEVLKSGVK